MSPTRTWLVSNKDPVTTIPTPRTRPRFRPDPKTLNQKKKKKKAQTNWGFFFSLPLSSIYLDHPYPYETIFMILDPSWRERQSMELSAVDFGVIRRSKVSTPTDSDSLSQKKKKKKMRKVRGGGWTTSEPWGMLEDYCWGV